MTCTAQPCTDIALLAPGMTDHTRPQPVANRVAPNRCRREPFRLPPAAIWWLFLHWQLGCYPEARRARPKVADPRPTTLSSVASVALLGVKAKHPVSPPASLDPDRAATPRVVGRRGKLGRTPGSGLKL